MGHYKQAQPCAETALQINQKDNDRRHDVEQLCTHIEIHRGSFGLYGG